MRQGVKWISVLMLSWVVSGCTVVAVASSAVGVAVDVVDAVTPDIVN